MLNLDLFTNNSYDFPVSLKHLLTSSSLRESDDNTIFLNNVDQNFILSSFFLYELCLYDSISKKYTFPTLTVYEIFYHIYLKFNFFSASSTSDKIRDISDNTYGNFFGVQLFNFIQNSDILITFCPKVRFSFFIKCSKSSFLNIHFKSLINSFVKFFIESSYFLISLVCINKNLSFDEDFDFYEFSFLLFYDLCEVEKNFYFNRSFFSNYLINNFNKILTESQNNFIFYKIYELLYFDANDKSWFTYFYNQCFHNTRVLTYNSLILPLQFKHPSVYISNFEQYKLMHVLSHFVDTLAFDLDISVYGKFFETHIGSDYLIFYENKCILTEKLFGCKPPWYPRFPIV